MLRLDTSIRPRRWQKEALGRWAKTQSGIVRVVTGGGKTVFAYMCLESFFSEHPRGRAMIIVPTVALQDQWFVDITDATDLEEDEIACYSGGSHPDRPRKINILVLNTARGLAPAISQGAATMLVVDECHRAGSPENSRALQGDHLATLGLSATPERESDDGLEERLVPSLGPITYRYDYPEAKKDGVIVDFALFNVDITVSDSGIQDVPALKSRVEAPLEGVESARRQRNREIIAASVARSANRAFRTPWAVKLALAHRDQRVIVFHERVGSLNRIVSMLAENGQNSVAYHSHLSESHRRDNLRLFRRGIVNILATCRALDEGANVPEAGVAIVAQSTSSTRQRIQRLGRVLRPAAGKECATVFTLYSGEDEARRLAGEAAGLEGVARVVWKRGAVK